MKTPRTLFKPSRARSRPKSCFPTTASIHWLSPGLAALSLLFAVALALGHHFFYLYWDGKTVASNTEQQWIIRVGTAFAFLVNALFVVAVSYSLTQQVWRSLGRTSAKVSEVDSLFSILSNILGFTKLRLWAARPVLAATAIIAWAVPIASIFPPGTLTVTFSQSSTNESLVVANFNYSKVSNFMTEYSTDVIGTPQLSDPNPELGRLSLATLSSLTTYQQTAPKTNCSFTMNVFGPALSCQDSTLMMQSFQNATFATGRDAGVQTSTVLFFAWAPQDGQNLTTLLNSSNSADYAGIDQTSNGSSQIYLYSNGPNFVQSLSGESQPAFVKCSLRNASYSLHFNFSNTIQTLTVVKRDLLNGIAASSLSSIGFYNLTNGSEAVQNEYVAYISVMTAFGNILTGRVDGIESHLSGHRYVALKTLATATQLGQVPGTWSNKTFAATTEQMFQNMTLSLLSSDSFTANRDRAAIPLDSVTVLTSQNIYVYKPSSLLISHGVAIIVVILVAVVGTIVLLSNGYSFDRNFSTVLRTTRHAQFSQIISFHDTIGAEPCVDDIQNLEVRYRPLVPNGEWAGFVPVQMAGAGAAGASSSLSSSSSPSVPQVGGDIEMTDPNSGDRVNAASQVLRFRNTNIDGGSYSRLHHNDNDTVET